MARSLAPRWCRCAAHRASELGALGLAAESGFRSHPPAAPSHPVNGTGEWGATMPSYTWLQAVRILAGREAGHPYIPDTTPPIPYWEPPRVKELLADGVATVMGVPGDGDRHEPIPAAAWMRLRIEFSRSDTKERPLETIARLPDKHAPDLTASRIWRDLQISAEGLAALQAAAGRFAQVPTIFPADSEMNDAQVHPRSSKALAVQLVPILVAIDNAAAQMRRAKPAP